MIIYPLIVAAVSAIFGLRVAGQYRRRRRPHQVLWAVSLAMSFIASVSYALTLATGNSPFWFRTYYLFGALLMPAYMGTGSLYLGYSRRTGNIVLLAVIVLSVLGAVLLAAAPIDQVALATLDGGPGTGVIKAGAWLPILIIMNTYGLAAVVWVALASGWRASKRRAAPGMTTGNVLLTLGVIILGAAGTAARLGSGGYFWLTMTAGWVVTYAGFEVIDRTHARGHATAAQNY